MTRKLLALVVSLCLAWFAAEPAGAAGDERILSFKSAIEVHADATMTVTETIVVRAAGDQINRCIYREFPTSYVDRFGPMGLANPPEGYDVVWIVPFVMLGGGIFAVRRVLLNWRGDRRASEAAPHAACPTKPGAYDDRLRRDLDYFEA